MYKEGHRIRRLDVRVVTSNVQVHVRLKVMDWDGRR